MRPDHAGPTAAARPRQPVVAAICALFAALLASCASAPPRPAEIARGDYAAAQDYASALIRDEMRRHDLTGLSIALVDDQRVVWAQGFGFADREGGVRADERTLYRIGSISKLFTDTAAMQLAEAGRLDIDRPLQSYVPEFRIGSRFADAAPITPRMLMAHHAGLPRDELLGFFTAQPEPFGLLVARMADEEIAYPPGKVFSYSNVGVTLLGVAVERVAGVPFADHLRDALLLPLGMVDSGFDTGRSASPRMAQGYRSGRRADETPLRDVPAGGLNSSVAEMSRFIEMVFAQGRSGERQILRPETVAQMQAPQFPQAQLDFDNHVGLGWMLGAGGDPALRDAGKVIQHAGGTILFRSQLMLLPEHKLGVVVLSNSDAAMATVARVAAETLALALQAKEGIRPAAAAARPPATQRALTAAERRDWPGDYTTAMGFVHVALDGDALQAELAGHRLHLVPNDDTSLRLDYAVLGLWHPDLGRLGSYAMSIEQLDGRQLLVASYDGRRALAGERIRPPADLGAWRARAGTYRITNAGADHPWIRQARLVEEHGFLLLEVEPVDSLAARPRVPLQPLSGTEARLLETLADGGPVIRVVSVDGEERLRYAGYLLTRVGP